jgi:anthranilate synthase component 1
MLTQMPVQDGVAQATRMVTVVREIPADLETPVSVYLKLAGREPSFLLESVTGGEQIARYSFIGVGPSQTFILRDRQLETRSPGGITIQAISPGGNPLDILRSAAQRYQAQPLAGLPRFSGGLVGYLGYECAAFFESKAIPEGEARLKAADMPPDAIFLMSDNIIAFDHAYGKLVLIANVIVEGDEGDARRVGENRLDEIQQRLEQPLPNRAARVHKPVKAALKSNTSKDEFMQAVLQAKEYIAAGDIFQVVLSQRFSRETEAAPFDIYRALRRLNPSPYMFFFDFGNLAGPVPLRIIGGSPEMHVRMEGRQAYIRPIAGTRPRGKSPEEDQALEADLLADPKECAEHVMLVDLARNDLGRVCEFGSVKVTKLMDIERYSHVMHIVSFVEGVTRPEFDSFDLLEATFPAGTVSGAPKIRAMQIISELEKQPRGPYAGAVGYFSLDGSMDTCITIRTLVMQGKTISVQAGAGIVADSQPELEYQETLNKARALAVAVEMAEKSAE